MSNDKKLDLTPKDFSFICPLNMDELTPIEGGYHCDSCEKKVYDVSHMSKSEFQTLQEKTKDLCISFKKVTTVAVALSTSAWVAADDNVTQVIFIDENRTVNTKNVLMGFSLPPQEKEKFLKVEKIDNNNTVNTTNDPIGFMAPTEVQKNTFKLGKVKVIPYDYVKTNITNALTPPVKCDLESSFEGDTIAPPYNEEESN